MLDRRRQLSRLDAIQHLQASEKAQASVALSVVAAIEEELRALYFRLTKTEQCGMQRKIQSIQDLEVKAVSAAVATARWPMNNQSARPVSALISVRVEGRLVPSRDEWPTNDLRLAENSLIDVVMQRLNGFEALERENATLKAKLARLLK